MSDQLFKKRKAREARELSRRKARRTQFHRYLVVCEGEKTEPTYFRALRQYLHINKVNLDIYEKKSGSDPSKIVILAEQQGRSSDYEKVFCVFDKDDHAHYENAVKRIDDLNKSKRFKSEVFAITSVPCFEIWIMLQFKECGRPYVAKGKKSPCDCCIEDLKAFLPNYLKSCQTIDQILPKTDTAIANAKKLSERCVSVNTANPSTNVHEMVETLMEAKKQKRL